MPARRVGEHHGSDPAMRAHGWGNSDPHDDDDGAPVLPAAPRPGGWSHPLPQRLRRGHREDGPAAVARQHAGRNSAELGQPSAALNTEPLSSTRQWSCRRSRESWAGRPQVVRRGYKRCLCILVAVLVLQQADGWIALSDKGYQVKHSLVAQAGVKVQGEVGVNGFIISKPVAQLQCNPSRRGAIRWNDKSFEGCNGETDWQPLSFCSRSCTINTKTVPCGLPVRNRCDKSCNQIGTGLNMRQCILNVASTPCQQPVRYSFSGPAAHLHAAWCTTLSDMCNCSGTFVEMHVG